MIGDTLKVFMLLGEPPGFHAEYYVVGGGGGGGGQSTEEYIACIQASVYKSKT